MRGRYFWSLEDLHNLTDKQRAAVIRSRGTDRFWARLAGKCGAPVEEVKRRVVRERTHWCSRCHAWKPWSQFDRARATRVGCYSCCVECRRIKDRGHENALGTMWSKAEEGVLFQRWGTEPIERIAALVGRSRGAVKHRAQCLGLKMAGRAGGPATHRAIKVANILGYKTKKTVHEWARYGLTRRRGPDNTLLITSNALIRFFRKRPEAVDVFAITQEQVEAIGWMPYVVEQYDAPCFGVRHCSGERHRHRKHPSGFFVTDLHAKQSRCPTCGITSSRWCEGYTDEWSEGLFSDPTSIPGFVPAPLQKVWASQGQMEMSA